MKSNHKQYTGKNKGTHGIFFRRIVCIIVVTTIMTTGCGKQQKAPELIEPIANNQSFRPVVRGDVGQIDIKIADVVPEEYCYFAKNAIEILDINVDFGEYVKKGQVLATVDTASQQTSMDALIRELRLKKNLFTNNIKIAKEQIKELMLQRKEYKRKHDKQGKKDVNNQIAVAKENLRFEKVLARHQERTLRDQMNDLKEDVENSTIRARHSGYVTYIKDMSETNMTNAMENIVIVSDYDDVHLELSEDISSVFYKQNIPRYDRIYVNIAGKERNVKTYSYTNTQLIAIQGAKLWPKIRLEIDGSTAGLQPGEKLPVCFAGDVKKNALKIGTDSLNSEGESYFVYVQKGKGKEKREIQIGYKNDMEVEVTKGLSEGEWVYYSSDSLMPSKYEEVTVNKQVFGENQDTETLKGVVKYTRLHNYQQTENASVENVYFKQGDKVKKGDLICVLDLETGGAKLKEEQQAIVNCRSDYRRQKKEMDKNILALQKQIKLQKKIENKQKKETNQQENSSETAQFTSVKQLICEKNIMFYQKKNLEKQYLYDLKNLQIQYDEMAKLNDGNGKRNIYARQNGILGKVNVFEGKFIDPEKETLLFQICDASSKKLVVQTNDIYVGAGNKASFTLGENKEKVYKKKIVGNSGVNGKAYLTEWKDKIYVTQSAFDEEKGNSFYLPLDKSQFDDSIRTGEVHYSKARIADMVVLPNELVIREVNKKNKNETDYYVWKVVDGVLVKQYITMEESLNYGAYICVLSGLSDGDIVAKQSIEK